MWRSYQTIVEWTVESELGRESVSLQIKTKLTWYGFASTTFDVMGRAERSSSGIFVSSLKRRRVHSRQM